jgi:hypothetical protein
VYGADADVADLQWLLDVPEDQRDVAEAAGPEGFPALRTGATAVAVGRRVRRVGSDGRAIGFVEVLEVQDVDDLIAGGVGEVEAEVSGAVGAGVEHDHVEVPVGRWRQGRGLVVVAEQRAGVFERVLGLLARFLERVVVDVLGDLVPAGVFAGEVSEDRCEELDVVGEQGGVSGRQI